MILGETNSADSPQEAPRFQFSIWSLLVVTTITAIVLSMRNYLPAFVDEILYLSLFAVFIHVMLNAAGMPNRLLMRRGLAANHRGNALFREGQYDQAIEEYRKAIELEDRERHFPTAIAAWHGFGRVKSTVPWPTIIRR